MISIFSYLEIAALTGEPVLIYGETGTGKDLIARAVHDASGRRGKYVTVNTAGIDDHSFSDTLFGHRRGAFTGASEDRQGLLYQAGDGTIMLDEIGDLSAESQIKLLRLIDHGEYYPLGSDSVCYSNAGIIAVANRDLKLMVAENLFRADLYYRLCTHAVEIPPLRRRPEDLPLLVSFFLPQLSSDQLSGIVEILRTYSFPGNVRELRSLLIDASERSSLGGSVSAELSKRLKAASECFSPAGSGADIKFPTIDEAVELLIVQALERTGGNQTAAAGLLGISKQALSRRIAKLRLNPHQ